jgi:lipopolysaccharide/colanic/teichoic acid biosynthesis glycosyltransferase
MLVSAVTLTAPAGVYAPAFGARPATRTTRPRAAAVPAGRIVGSAAKRALDVAGALLGLLLAAPVLLLAALAVRYEGGPGILFRQRRVGLGGATFTLYKLRSLRPAGTEADTRWSIADDARLGPVGRFIRKTSIDELPQLINVLRGEMSLVGPRPERPHFADRFAATVPGYADRHRVRPGLTGLAVVQGLRGDTSIPLRAHYDNLYIDTWTFTQDLVIIVRTLRHLATGS